MEFRRFVNDGVEYRFDPLTGDQCRINPQRAKRLRQTVNDEALRQMVANSRESCPFCPEHVEQMTPKFPEKNWEEGRIKFGQTLIFPNLNPFGENHAVAIITQAHFLPLDEFSTDMLCHNLLASKGYILAVHRRGHEATWPTYMWNYMPPSAGSIIHPHAQILVESKPLPKQAQLLEKSQQYMGSEGNNYWEELVKQERKLGERFIYQSDFISVLASFAPRGFNEIQFVFRDKSSLGGLEEEEIQDFASCLVRALRGYRNIGVGSFNLITFSGPLGKNLDYYRLHAKLISRPHPAGIYTSDTGPLERLCDAWVIDTLPEVVAERLKPFFS
jgi:galactose-1-phosphate uridylyltransferase